MIALAIAIIVVGVGGWFSFPRRTSKVLSALLAVLGLIGLILAVVRLA